MPTTSPDNKNFLSPIGFQLSVNRLPHVNYFCTSVTIPEMSIGRIDNHDTPFIRLPHVGDKIQFGELNLRFRVDEDMKNFIEIYDWIEGMGYPDNFEQRRAFEARDAIRGDVFSDGSLTVLTSSYKPNIDIKFVDMFPTAISSVEFSVEQTDIEYLVADVNFVYRRYHITPLA